MDDRVVQVALPPVSASLLSAAEPCVSSSSSVSAEAFGSSYVIESDMCGTRSGVGIASGGGGKGGVRIASIDCRHPVLLRWLLHKHTQMMLVTLGIAKPPAAPSAPAADTEPDPATRLAAAAHTSAIHSSGSSPHSASSSSPTSSSLAPAPEVRCLPYQASSLPAVLPIALARALPADDDPAYVRAAATAGRPLRVIQTAPAMDVLKARAVVALLDSSDQTAVAAANAAIAAAGCAGTAGAVAPETVSRPSPLPPPSSIPVPLSPPRHTHHHHHHSHSHNHSSPQSARATSTAASALRHVRWSLESHHPAPPASQPRLRGLFYGLRPSAFLPQASRNGLTANARIALGLLPFGPTRTPGGSVTRLGPAEDSNIAAAAAAAGAAAAAAAARGSAAEAGAGKKGMLDPYSLVLQVATPGAQLRSRNSFFLCYRASLSPCEVLHTLLSLFMSPPGCDELDVFAADRAANAASLAALSSRSSGGFGGGDSAISASSSHATSSTGLGGSGSSLSSDGKGGKDGNGSGAGGSGRAVESSRSRTDLIFDSAEEEAERDRLAAYLRVVNPHLSSLATDVPYVEPGLLEEAFALTHAMTPPSTASSSSSSPSQPPASPGPLASQGREDSRLSGTGSLAGVPSFFPSLTAVGSTLAPALSSLSAATQSPALSLRALYRLQVVSVIARWVSTCYAEDWTPSMARLVTAVVAKM